MKRFLFFTVVSLFSLSTIRAEDYPQKFEGAFEAWGGKKVELILPFLPTEPIILHAGAHYGNELIDYITRWQKYTIFAFEPNPHAFEILSKKMTQWKNAFPHKLALSDKTGPATLYVCHGSQGNDPVFEHASSLLPPSEYMEVHYQGPRITVHSVLLDEWCRQNGIDHIDLLRLDLQGSELQVLKSSPQILNSIKVVHVETYFFPFRKEITSYSELKSFLESAGFRLLAHWYREGLQGSAIFVKNSFFEDAEPNHEASSGIHFKEETLALVKKHVRPGWTAIDVGAKEGNYTVAMAQKMGARGMVIAFEPHSNLFETLQQNLKAHNCDNVLALCRTVSHTQLHLDTLNLQKVSLIRIDAPGKELEVLQGAHATISRSRPVLLFTTNSDNSTLFSLIKSYGYKVQLISENDYIAVP